MLDTDVHSLSCSDSLGSSHLMAELEAEEDGWVIVKKQRINILVPPTTNPTNNSIQTTSRNVRKRLEDDKKRCYNLSKVKHNKSSTTSIPANGASADGSGINSRDPDSNHNIITKLTATGTSADGNGISSRAQESNHNIVAPLKKLKELQLAEACNDRGKIMVCNNTRIFGGVPRSLPIGSLNVINKRMRALNLERKLKGFGGLRRWLVSQGLDRFVNIFEREKLGKYQLANLSMSKLKDMGTDAVGPRRKLIHGIDNLCQPYYVKVKP